jgi:hypothetical protein
MLHQAAASLKQHSKSQAAQQAASSTASKYQSFFEFIRVFEFQLA